MNAELLCLPRLRFPRRGSASVKQSGAECGYANPKRKGGSTLSFRAFGTMLSRGRLLFGRCVRLLQGGSSPSTARDTAPERRVGGPSRLGGLRRRLTVLGRRPGREIMSSGCVAASQKPPEFYRASSPESRIPEPALAPARLRLLSGREEPAARPRPRETPIADAPARPPRDQKAEKPTPQRTGKPSRAGGATSPHQQ